MYRYFWTLNDCAVDGLLLHHSKKFKERLGGNDVSHNSYASILSLTTLYGENRLILSSASASPRLCSHVVKSARLLPEPVEECIISLHVLEFLLHYSK